MIPILTFKPVLIGCQYGLYVVYGASAAKETQKQGLRAITSRAGKIPQFRRCFMKTGLNKRQKTTAILF